MVNLKKNKVKKIRNTFQHYTSTDLGLVMAIRNTMNEYIKSAIERNYHNRLQTNNNDTVKPIFPYHFNNTEYIRIT